MNADRAKIFRLKNSVFENNILYAQKNNYRELDKAFLHPIKDFEADCVSIYDIGLSAVKVSGKQYFKTSIADTDTLIDKYPKLEHLLTFEKPLEHIIADHWSEKEAFWKTFAEVSASNSEKVEQLLQQHGATYFQRCLDVPSYASKHKIPSPKSLKLNQGNAEIIFTPFVDKYEEKKHIYEFSCSYSFEGKQEILDFVMKNFKAFSWNNIMVAECIPSDREKEPYHVFITKRYRNKSIWKALTHQDNYTDKKGSYIRLEKEDEDRFKEAYLEPLNSKLFFIPSAIERIQEHYERIVAHPHIDFKFTLEFQDVLPSDQFQDLELSDQDLIKYKFKQEVKHYCKKHNLPYEVRKLLEKVFITGDLDIQDYNQEISWTEKDILPHSEKGFFEIKYCSPETALKILQTMGLFDQVEYDEKRDYFNRISVKHVEHQDHSSFIVPQSPLILPQSSMVLHGMTGIKAYQDLNTEICNRLQSMVDFGGILSSFERRRLGLTFHSMSPLGDIAAGIDKYVPCKVGNAPHYGSSVFFGMKPEIVHRKDMFFAPYDFGAGVKDRHKCFQEYAKSIGQENIYLPASYQARKKHFDACLEHTDNEIYFKYQIDWQEIDSVWLVDIQNQEAIINFWADLCHVHQELHDINFHFVNSDELQTTISNRADKINI